MPLSFSSRSSSDVLGASTQCAILPIFAKTTLSADAKCFDSANKGLISNAIKLKDFSGKSGESLLLPGAGNAKRLLLVGLGERAEFDRKAAREFSNSVYMALNQTRATDAILHGSALGQSEHCAWTMEYLARHLTSSSYRYTRTVSKPKPPISLRKLTVNPGKALSKAACQTLLERGARTGEGINEARELANLPGNICTPTYLAQQARKWARGEKGRIAKVLDEKKMRELGMHSLLSVSAGSDQPAKLIIMEYKGGKAKAAPYVLVGKGITFDTGGISLKPGAKMDEMKFDMGGAASVFGTMHAVASLGLPINVVGIVAAAENMPSGGATKPGDVVTSMAGKTIEILNTDAEGRLVLCDALTYAERYKPAALVDIATLTGACVVALGSHATGLYANRDDLAEQLLAAGEASYDRAWRMPLWDEYQAQLNSNFADMANIGGPGGGSVTAACFLARFTEAQNWAHLDIAGSAWNSAPKGATGRPVALLTRYLMDRAGL